MSQGANYAPADRNRGHVKKFQFRRRLSGRLLDHFHRGRALHLKSIGLANDGPGAGNGSFISFEFHIVSAGFAVILNPVVNRRPTDDVKKIFLQVEQDDIANDKAIVIAGYELLGPVRFETIETVHAKIG